VWQFRVGFKCSFLGEEMYVESGKNFLRVKRCASAWSCGSVPVSV
jgi:hypothetical protein